MSRERRISHRVDCRIQAYLQRSTIAGQVSKQVYLAEIEEMSDTGLRLRTPVLLPEGERVTLYMGRRDGPVAYRRDLEVVWSGKNSGPGSRIGARLLGHGFRRHAGSIDGLVAN